VNTPIEEEVVIRMAWMSDYILPPVWISIIIAALPPKGQSMSSEAQGCNVAGDLNARSSSSGCGQPMEITLQKTNDWRHQANKGRSRSLAEGHHATPMKQYGKNTLHPKMRRGLGYSERGRRNTPAPAAFEEQACWKPVGFPVSL